MSVLQLRNILFQLKHAQILTNLCLIQTPILIEFSQIFVSINQSPIILGSEIPRTQEFLTFNILLPIESEAKMMRNI